MDTGLIAIVGFYAGINAILLLWLTFRVISVRRAERISLNYGENAYLERLQRGHANAAETMPIFFIMMGIAALMGTPALVLHGVGLLFTVGRIIHAAFFVRRKSTLRPRVWGMLITIIAIGLLAVGLVTHSLFLLIT
ncbi:MAG: MAPEG family protein [Pseudomonadota bacterium]